MNTPTSRDQKSSIPKTFSFRGLLIGLLLVFWVWMLIDLVTHPFTAGPNAGGAIFRWLSALTGIATVLTALFIMRRVPGNPVGFLLFLWGVGSTGWSLRSVWENIPIGILANSTFALIFFCISCPAAISLIFYFPDGKPYPARLSRWMPYFTGLLCISGLFYLFGFSGKGAPGNLPNILLIPALEGLGQIIYLVVFLVGMTIGLVSLILRYRTGDDRLRVQIRWLAWLLGIGILLGVIPFGRLAGSGIAIFFQMVSFIFWQSFLALGIGIAMLRHNLWGIDVIIRRTLVYTSLTAILALIYFGGVTLLQAFSASIFGLQSPVIIVISTLVIAGLFNPLRTGLQNGIDRRFYRRKYDAEKALADFASVARNETTLEPLTQRLVGVVEDAMQPEKVSLWLKPVNERKRKTGK